MLLVHTMMMAGEAPALTVEREKTMATASDFAIDSNVHAKANKARKGVVIGNKLSDGDQVVAVEWADGTLAKVNVNDIQTCLSIEEEFKALQSQVGDKIAAAAELLNEANKLAGEAGYCLGDSYDFYEQVRPLLRAMDNAGWSTSSLSC